MSSSIKTPTWFWVVSSIALVWNLLGVMAFVAQMSMTPEMMDAMSEAERAGYENMPLWAIVAFGFAVFGGSIGSLLLLLKKRLAFIVFILSMFGILVQQYHSFFVVDSVAIYGPGATIMPAMVLVVGVLLIWMANSSIKKGWIK